MPLKREVKVAMPEQPANERVRNFREVNAGYNLQQAMFEAERCLRCQDPLCIEGCPVNIPIPDFIHAIAKKDFREAASLIRRANPLPAICGRVCPQESQCEQLCHMGTRFRPVAIGALERFVADWERSNPAEKSTKPYRSQKVAVVGSGPAGLVCAGELASLGYPVTIFEALHAPGGVLRYGIPEFRLPKAILDSEIDQLKRIGVEIVTNVIIGKTLSIDQLFDEYRYSAVFIGSGAGLPQFLNIPGENLVGVYSANEFLTRMNLMRAYSFPSTDTPLAVGGKIAVIGAGNTAMDAVRSALRMGAEEGHIVYRRSEKEMSARVEEYHHAIAEGVQFHWLTNPVEIVGDKDGHVAGLKCQRMKLGEPDASGRARPIPIPDSEFVFPVDTVILAIGTTPNPLLVKTTGGLATNQRGCLKTDGEGGKTTLPRVYAGGDAVTGAATVILAAGAGKKAAAAIHRDLSSEAGGINGHS